MKRLLTTPTVVVASVLLLAGCGGGGSNNETPPTEAMPAPAEQCKDDGGIYEDGECKSADDLRKEGKDDAAQSSQDTAAAEAALDLHSLLGITGVTPAADAKGVTTVVKGGANPAGFTSAKDTNKFSQSVRLEGARFSATTLTATDFSGANDGITGFYTIDTGNYANAKADAFGGIALKTHDSNAQDGDLNDFVTTGTYRGVSGTLRCLGTCTSQDGNPVGGTSWHFKPNNAMDRVTGPKIEWGWWLTRDDGGDVMAVNRFRPDQNLTPSGTLTVSTGMGGLGSGTASYEGNAIGQYAVVGDSGAFKAKASLTATFGEATIPLSGSIHTFMGADGESRGWMIDLKEIAATDAGVAENGTTVWGGNELVNAWNADMYNGSGTELPDVILGDFNAESQGGRMTGVFGAKPDN